MPTTDNPMARLQGLDLGFRSEYLDYRTLTRQLRGWAEAFPELVRLESIGRTPEGRDQWLLTVGPEPDRVRPAVWVDGNMHAAELAGSSVALAIAEAAIRMHLKPAPDTQVQREMLFHVLPRISPDGAEAVLRGRGFVRSVPRRKDHGHPRPRWQREDLDGDGHCRFIRIPDPGGEFVASATHPGLMLPRRPDDPPPWYRLYPEGRIENWDGETLPDPEFLDGSTDLNRNFPHDWRGEPEQAGAGSHPTGEPESRAVVDYAIAHPNLYAWLNLHTFGGVFIRPLGTASDARMNQADLALYRQLEAWAEADTGYPTVSAYEEFTYEPEKPVYGDLMDFVYNQRGCLSQVCELWDLFARLELPRRKPFVRSYFAVDREGMERLAEWDAASNRGRVYRDWTTVEHPQLGKVEVGGPDPLIGLWNPPPELLPDVCERMCRYWLRVVALLPRLVLEELVVDRLDTNLVEIRATVANHGYLPTWGLDSSREQPWNTPLQAHMETRDCRLTDPERARRDVGHLDGWGRGLEHGSQTPWFMHSRGNSHRRSLRWLVHGEGKVTLRVGNERVGWVERTVTAG